MPSVSSGYTQGEAAIPSFSAPAPPVSLRVATFGPPLVVYAALALYLARPTQHSFDGFAYVEQAATAEPWARAVHVGFLLPLWVAVRLGSAVGIAPHVVANAVAASFGAWLLVELIRVGEVLLQVDSAGRAAPPLIVRWAPALCWLSLPTAWDHALFCEVYGPLAAITLAAARHHAAGRVGWATALFVWAVAVHPGALALALAAAVLPSRHRAVPALVAALSLVVLGLVLPEWWGGGRGLAASPPFDRSPWQSLQASVRLLWRELAVLAFLPMVGLVARRESTTLTVIWRNAGVVAVLLSALILDRYRDNPGQLPAVAWLVPFAAPGAQILLAALPQRVTAAFLATLLIVGVAEGSSRHDAVARAAMRAQADR